MLDSMGAGPWRVVVTRDDEIDAAVRRSLEMWPLLAQGQCQRAMLKLHSDPDKPPKPGSSESKVSSS